MKNFSLPARHVFAVLLVVGLFAVSCKKEKSSLNPGEITGFRFEASKNPNILSADINGIISGKTITAVFPQGVDLKSLVASFAFVGKSVTVNGTAQQSSVTVNNFEQPLTYKVLGYDDVEADYAVKIERVAAGGLSLTDFKILKANNALLAGDYSFTERQDSFLLHIPPAGVKSLVPVFTTTAKEVYANGVLQQSGITSVDFSTPVKYTVVSQEGFKKTYIVHIDWLFSIPHIYVNTNGGAPINSKDVYVTAAIRIEGHGVYPDYENTTRIRGRGNTTWGKPKKPYRLKLDKNAPLFGLPEEKDWVLLANYLDGTLMLNSVAMKAGKLLGLPYVNNTIPVDLTINGQYMGSYVFTEQVEVGTNRVNIGSDGTLLELDTNFDEDYQFWSANYALPVMIKEPSLTGQPQVAAFKTDFEKLENLVAATSFPNNNYKDFIDAESLVNYLIVYQLTDNEEINHPKSTYMHKVNGGKYFMGPIWDFDWAFGYDGGSYFGASYTRPLFWSTAPPPGKGTRFFSRFLLDPAIRTLYKQKWTEFKSSKLPVLQTFIDEYASLIGASQQADYKKWRRGSGNFEGDVGDLKRWLANRATYIDNFVSGF